MPEQPLRPFVTHALSKHLNYSRFDVFAQVELHRRRKDHHIGESGSVLDWAPRSLDPAFDRTRFIASSADSSGAQASGAF